MRPEYASSAYLVLGTSFLLLSKPEEAIRHLEMAKAGGSPSRKSAISFYLGESYAALGRPREAQMAYQQARKALQNGKFGLLSLERLQPLSENGELKIGK
jgi:tetratricopeptide (TPR) repeat protein